MVTAEGFLDHIQKLLRDNDIPKLPEEYAENILFVEIHEDLKVMRETLAAFSLLQKKKESLAIMNDKLRKEVERIEHLKESEAHLEFLASHDPLTGIINRRSFIEIVSSELTNAAELHVPCCLAMMDIDHFTKFNETHGKEAGDEALRHTVKTIESKLRKHDFMGRYGEGKFILFFYGVDEKIGMKVLERLRENLSETSVPLEKGPAVVHASFGFVATKTDEKVEEKGYLDKLIEKADAALFAAKQAGRDRVAVFGLGMELRGGEGLVEKTS